MESYNDFAYIYDDLMYDFNYVEWSEYIEEIFKKYKVTPNNILEMACGTGNLTYELSKAGHKITAFDLSEEMLSIAYGKLSQFKRTKLLNLDMTSYKLNEKFTSVISICDSINYIQKIENLKKTFKNVYNHLEDDGIFIFDINSEYKLREIIGNNTFIYDKDEIFYTWENELDEENKLCNFFLTFFIENEENSYERFDEHHVERIYTIKEIQELLGEVGFSKIDYYKAFSFEQVEYTTQRINFVVRK